MTLADSHDDHAHMHFASRSEIDTGTWTAIIGAIVAIVTAVIAAFVQLFVGRKKADEDAQVTVVNGFISLVTQSETRIARLEARNTELESNNQKQDRRIALLEHTLIKNGLDVPEETHS